MKEGKFNFTDAIFDKVSKDVDLDKTIIKDVLKRFRTFEVDDIKDLLNNYPFLSQLSEVPDSCKNLLQSNKLEEYTVEITEQETKELGDTKEIAEVLGTELIKYFELISSTGMVFNFINLDNVYLNNFKFWDKHFFGAVEFNINDINDDNLEGIFIYRDFTRKQIDERERGILETVVGSSIMSKFDLVGRAVNQDILKEYFPNSEIKRKLLVDKIRKHRDYRDSKPPEEIISPLYSPIYDLV